MAYTPAAVDYHKLLDDTKNVAQIIGVIVGGLWVYFNYFKGRTYRPRLELKVSGRIFVHQQADYVLATSEVKNVGLTNVEIKQVGSAMRLFGFRPDGSTTIPVAWRRIHTVSVLTEHKWIEPGESILETQLLPVPGIADPAFKVELRIVSGNLEWNATCIFDRAWKQTNVSDETGGPDGRASDVAPDAG